MDASLASYMPILPLSTGSPAYTTVGVASPISCHLVEPLHGDCANLSSCHIQLLVPRYGELDILIWFISALGACLTLRLHFAFCSCLLALFAVVSAIETFLLMYKNLTAPVQVHPLLKHMNHVSILPPSSCHLSVGQPQSIDSYSAPVLHSVSHG